MGLTTRLAAFPVPAWRSAAAIAVSDHQILLAGLHTPSVDDAIFVADDAGVVLGFLFVVTRTDYFTHEPFAYVEDLALAAAAEGKGLGRRLMEEAEGWARDRGFRHIGLSVWAQNSRARGFYERLGYQPETMKYLKEL
ncbi:MAG: GNAT family N-acetyltransferase [Gemmatimonadales bacterium]